jgi:hypothetical protein
MKLKTAHRRVVDPKLNRSIITSNNSRLSPINRRPRLIHSGNRKTHTGTSTTNNTNTKTTTKQSKNPCNKPLNPTPQTQNTKKHQKTPKNNKKPPNPPPTLKTKILQNLPFTINIVNLPLNMLVPPRILLIPFQKLHPLASKHIALFFSLKTNQVSPSNLSQIPSQKPIAQIRLIHNLRFLGTLPRDGQYIRYDIPVSLYNYPNVPPKNRIIQTLTERSPTTPNLQKPCQH